MELDDFMKNVRMWKLLTNISDEYVDPEVYLSNRLGPFIYDQMILCWFVDNLC